MIFGTGRDALEALPRTLGLLALQAELRGDAATADALADGARRVAALSVPERRALARHVRAGESHPHVHTTALAAAIEQALDRGGRETSDAALDALPGDLATLLRRTAADPLDIVRAHRTHGVVSGADVAAALAGRAGHDASRDGDALAALAPHVAALRELRPRLPLGRAIGLAERIERALDAAAGVGQVRRLGSVRRFEPTVGDVELLLVHEQPASALERAVATLDGEVRYRSDYRALLHVDRRPVALRAAAPSRAPWLQLWHTGSTAHLEHLRARARGLGLTLRPDGLFSERGDAVACASEADAYGALRLQFIPAEMRHGEEEIASAAAGAIAPPIDVRDIRGDLHTHTLWSDGRDTVETMVYGARRRGYEYIAITDHSPGAAAARVLTIPRLARQAEDVARVRALVPEVSVLHGVEVDILEDGSLDLPDEILGRLDIVLASLHDPCGHSPARLLERYARAMRHPHVHVVTHPANRVPGRTAGYDLDFDALFRLAAETQTALEVDGGAGHLDLDGRLAGRAAAAGVTLVIDSDCHDAQRLGRQMRLGVGTARRGGVEARHVLNTRPLADVRAFVAAKRRAFN